MPNPLNVFCCYAHEDQELLAQLKRHLAPLQRQNLITIWSDKDINAGIEWEKELDKHLECADIVLLLISPDFMDSDYCYGTEMVRTLARHNESSTVAIPILLRPTLWQNSLFAKLQIIPTGAKPVTSWSNQDEAYYDIAQHINRVISTSPEFFEGKVHLPLDNDAFSADEKYRQEAMGKEKSIVFYSWQSDLDPKTNHYFIQDALKKAIKIVRKDDEIEVEPVMDRDTQGVAESPDITKTIFDKIDQAHIFVCDVSVTNKNALEHNPRTRLTPNPNVLMELGYALRKIGHERIIMVMNTAYGSPEQLPFDLRSRRIARFSLREDGDYLSERERLEETLAESLQLSLSSLNTLTAQDIDKAKQEINAIRETYQILIRVDGLCDDLLYEINNVRLLSLDDAIRKIRTIKLTADRIKELIPLDFPALKPDLKNYSSTLE